jgi:hypothetical protein
MGWRAVTTTLCWSRLYPPPVRDLWIRLQNKFLMTTSPFIHSGPSFILLTLFLCLRATCELCGPNLSSPPPQPSTKQSKTQFFSAICVYVYLSCILDCIAVFYTKRPVWTFRKTSIPVALTLVQSLSLSKFFICLKSFSTRRYLTFNGSLAGYIRIPNNS